MKRLFSRLLDFCLDTNMAWPIDLVFHRFHRRVVSRSRSLLQHLMSQQYKQEAAASELFAAIQTHSPALRACVFGYRTPEVKAATTRPIIVKVCLK